MGSALLNRGSARLRHLDRRRRPELRLRPRDRLRTVISYAGSSPGSVDLLLFRSRLAMRSRILTV
jgi:hypothetical protein